MATSPPADAPLPAWAQETTRDIQRELPALVPLQHAAAALARHPRTLTRAAARGELVIVRGEGGCALVPRCELVRWVATYWRRLGEP